MYLCRVEMFKINLQSVRRRDQDGCFSFLLKILGLKIRFSSLHCKSHSSLNQSRLSVTQRERCWPALMWSLPLSKNILENSSSKTDQSDRLSVSLIDHPLCQSQIEYVSVYLSSTSFYGATASLWQICSKHSEPGTASNMLIPLRNSSLMKQESARLYRQSWTSDSNEILLGSNQQQNQSTTWAAGLDPAAILCICGSAENNHSSRHGRAEERWKNQYQKRLFK